MNKLTTMALMTVVLAQPLQAADIASEVRSGDNGPDTGDGGFLEVGVAAGLWTNPLVVDRHQASYGVILAGEYRYKGLFIESISGSADGLNLGYKLWNNRQWTVDLIGVNATSGSTNEVDPHLGDTARTVWLLDRHVALTGAGFRVTRHFDDYVFQFRALNDIYNNRGNYGTARLGRSWQYRNWNFHTLAGVEYLDSRFSQHVYGISAREATRSLPQYSPGSIFAAEAEVGVTYPVTEHWVFRATVRHTFFPNAVADSPLFDKNSASSFATSFSYVF